MNWPPVSLAIPCWKRPDILAKTLTTIRAQKYPGELDLIIVEDDYDGGVVEDVALRFGARYLSRRRVERDELFQSTAVIWNMCLGACTSDISIMQTDDILHETPGTIEACVTALSEGRNILAMPLIKSLKADGSFDEWFSHGPKDGGGERLSGTGPHAFHLPEMRATGGYEETFYGYGYDDNYFFYSMRENGFIFKHLDVPCAHQFHERLRYDTVTGHANRSLINILITEIQDGTRKPIANSKPLDIDLSGTHAGIDDILNRVRNYPRTSTILPEWEKNCWTKDKHYERTAEAHRGIASERAGRPISETECKTSIMDEMICESAWALVQSEAARVEAIRTEGDRKKVSNRASDIIHTWASVALRKANQLAGELK